LLGEAATHPILYSQLAEWWPVLSAPEDYKEEAAFYRQVILSASLIKTRTLLELGSGGGNNASHLKAHFRMTLVDLSSAMLDVSTQLNPECEHIQGDMRSVRLECQFDAVFIHDAIVYLTTRADLQQAIETAYHHCRRGGVALFAPDHTLETFQPSTSHGGHDREYRSLRYLDWTWDPDPSDTSYISEMVYLMREGEDEVQCVHDRHVCGLFSRQTWLDAISNAGFIPESLPFLHSEVEPGTAADVFLGRKPNP